MDVGIDAAREAVAAIMRVHGVPDRAAHLQADVLIDAELRGHASHGLLRVPRLTQRIVNGVADPTATGLGTWAGDSLLLVDGQDGLGPVVALEAIHQLADRVNDTGIAAAAIGRSNHLGSLSWYVEQIAERGLIGIGLSTSEALVHPWGGRVAMVGSNPIAIAVPANPHPLVFDMATSEVSMGKIIDHANRGSAIPSSWAVDADGQATTDPAAALGGAISPFGGPKGYGLGLAIEVLVASMSGTEFGRHVRGTLDASQPSSKGDFFVVIRQPEADRAAAAVSAYLDDVRASPVAIDADGPVRVPGDRAAALRTSAGTSMTISVPDQLWDEIQLLRQGLAPVSSSVPGLKEQS